MKITGARIGRFLDSPPNNLCGTLFFGPDRGRVKHYAKDLSRHFVTDSNDSFATTILTADDLLADPARFHDEMTALSLLGDKRFLRLRLDHERSGAAISKAIKAFDKDPSKCEAKLIIEAGNLTPRSAIRLSLIHI